jgi:hypothetical protein
MSLAVPTVHNDPWPIRIDSDGVIRVGAGRLTLATMLDAMASGTDADAVAEEFRQTCADVYGALSYYYRHRTELKPYLDEKSYEAFQLRSEIEKNQTTFPTQAELQERLDLLVDD